MIKKISTIISVIVLILVASLGLDSVTQEASAHNICSLTNPSIELCAYSVPPKPGEAASARRWYTANEHTPGYHNRVWFDYEPTCTKVCRRKGANKTCAEYTYNADSRSFPGINDINGPTSGKKRLYCGQGTSSPVPHLHFVE